MRKVIIVLLTLCIAVFLIVMGSLYPNKKLPRLRKVHFHAGFVVVENNKKVDFSDTKYMFIKPCVAEGQEDGGSEDEQEEKAHLHDGVGDVVHIERTGATWQDLFTNIRYPVDYKKTTGYINNKKIPDFQKQSIRPFDSLVVFIGDNDPKYLTDGVTKEYIEIKAKKSVECGR